MASRCTRRAFLRRSGQALAGVALWRLFGPSAVESAAATPAPPAPLRASCPPGVKVVGVGGAGVHAVARMLEQGVAGAEVCFADTNVQPAFYLPGTRSLLLGPHLARGLGAGGLIGRGEAAALESAAELRAMLAGAEMAVIVAGLGGGSGGGAGPVVARLAREAGAAVVALVTMPFYFEGRRRHEQAETGLEALLAAADAVIAIPADALIASHGHSPLSAVFCALDDVVRRAARSLIELVAAPGLICVDADSLRAVLASGGAGRMGLGQAEGLGAPRRAVEDALRSPFLAGPIDDAQSVVLAVRGGRGLTAAHAIEAGMPINEVAHPYANLLRGATIDPTLPAGRVEVTLFAAAGSPGSSR